MGDASQDTRAGFASLRSLVIDTACAFLSLGCLFGWSTQGWNKEGTVFGVSAPDAGSPFHICLQAAIALTLVAISFARPLTCGAPRRKTVRDRLAIAGTVAAVLGVLAFWLGSGLGSGIVILLAGVLAGAGQGAFMWAWLDRHRMHPGVAFVVVSLASAMGFFAHLFSSLFGNAPSRVLSVVFPPLACLLLLGPRTSPLPSPDAAEGTDTRTSLPYAVSLLLCCFASGVASFSVPFGSNQSTCLIIVCLVGLSVIGIFARPSQSMSLFVGLSLCTCALVALALIVPGTPTWFGSLVFSGFWLLEIYAIAWFSQQRGGAGMSAQGAHGLAAVYALSALANVVGMHVSGQAAYAVALALTAGAFAITLVATTRLFAPDAAASSGVDTRQATLSSAASPHPHPDDFAQRLDLLAEQHGLTGAERRVFAYLARGFSLKQISLEVGVSENTAKYHRRSIYQKLGVSSRQELINLVDADEETLAQSGQKPGGFVA